MPSYKLFYFNGKGRAEVIRFIFAQTGVEYEDVRFSKEEWPQYKQGARSYRSSRFTSSNGKRKHIGPVFLH